MRSEVVWQAFRNWASFHKIKFFKTWWYQIMSKIKKILPNSYFSMGKKQKDFDDFRHRKLNCILISQILALFDTSHYTNSQKFNSFLWECWFVAKDIYNFVSVSWKLHNRYCHNVQNFSLSMNTIYNVCHAEKRTKPSGILLLQLVRFSAWQIL